MTSPPEVDDSYSPAVRAAATVLLVIGVGGAFENAPVEAGTSDCVKDVTDSWSLSTLVPAGLVAAVFRVARVR
ncbi:hypothetical protein RND61_03130 [Streptomyces sp. TRM76323]|uniref:Secreted protein n=1 Tax=Streptomyces tamarix TaxID=3078565 RepID=A0ABU3QEY3_9ACTN|nr:hypothetical protein [Streptomyces tamarix]MDT9681073.1 hypothetical protein [Streptomyces tamarix]